MRATQFINVTKGNPMSKNKQHKKNPHKYFGNSVKPRADQVSVVNVIQAKLFHAMIGNLYHEEQAFNIDVGRYVNPADLFPLETVVIAQDHCEFGIELHGRQVAQAASIGYNARHVIEILKRMTKEFEDASCVRCLYIVGNKIVAPVVTFVEALWEACGIVVRGSHNEFVERAKAH